MLRRSFLATLAASAVRRLFGQDILILKHRAVGTGGSSSGIVFDTAVDGGNNGNITTSLTWSHTVSGANTLLVIAVTGDHPYGSDDITSVTYNGVACTLIAKLVLTGQDRNLYMYALLGAATGAHNIVVNCSNVHYLIGQSASWNGVAQTGQPDAWTINESASSPVSTSLTTVADNCIAIACYWGYGGAAAGTNTTRRILDFAFSSGGIFESSLDPIHPAGSAGVNVTWNAVAAASVVMASFKPA
jgi:hypothetical protein